MNKTILITGASSGIGRAAAIEFSAKGWYVIASMRNPEKEQELIKNENILVTKLDVENPDSIRKAIEDGILKFRKIDAVVNNAGYGLNGIFEAITPAQIQKQFDVNVFGVMNVIREILPHFRSNKNGLILNVSSGAGRFTLPIISLYAASKFALEGFSEALSYELASQNIAVKIVEPGGVYTNFGKVAGENFAINPDLTDYDVFNAGAAKIFEGLQAAKLSTAEEVAEVIYTAVTDGSDTLRYAVGEDIKPLLKARYGLPDQEYVNFMRDRFMPKI